MAYTTIDDPSAHFQATIYTGNGSANHAITNTGNSDLQPDFVWIKNRSANDSHQLFDSSRGATKVLSSDLDHDEETDADTLDSFASDGFQVDADVKVNTNTELYVAWQWKANGGSRTTNAEDGDNPAGGYQANTTAGFSIVDYTGTGANGTMAHGLGAVPTCMIVKNRDEDDSWAVYHSGNTSAPETDYLVLNDAALSVDDAAWWNDTAPSSTVFTVATDHSVNADAENYIAYCFTPIQGYSKFGSYKGNGNASGPFIHTGFKPALVILKKYDTGTGNWYIYDNARHPTNPITKQLWPDGKWDEGTSTDLDFTSNGFKLFDSASTYTNIDGVGYIYIAFAEQPFVTSGGVPCTAR